MKTKLIDVFSDIITGEWGDEDVAGIGVSVIKTTCFQNDGKIDFDKTENRLIQKKIKDENGNVQYVIDEDKIEKKELQEGDIIIEKSGGGIGSPVGRVVFFEAPDKKTYLCNNFTQTLRVNKLVANPKYIFYYLKYLHKRGNVLKYQNQTTGIFNLKLEKYLQEVIPLFSLDKQLSIVTQLDTIQNLIDTRNEKIEISEKLVKSIYFDFFGDPVNNQKGNSLKKLSQIVKKDKIVTYGITQAGPHIEDGVPYIKSGDIKNGKILIGRLNKTSKKIASKFDRSKCETGDVVLSIRASIGDCAIVPLELNGVNLTQGTARVSPNLEIINSEFLFHTIGSDGFKFLISKHAKGVTFKEISLTKLRLIEIPVPDIELQNEFSVMVKELYSLRDYFDESLSLMNTLFQSVLQNAFKENVKIDEEPIFKELIKKFTIDDLKGNKNRLQYLVDLFDSKKFDSLEDYSDAKEKLFQLIEQDKITQQLTDNSLKLQVK